MEHLGKKIRGVNFPADFPRKTIIIVEICGLFQWTLISKHETSLVASYWDHGALGMVHGISQVTSDTTPEC